VLSEAEDVFGVVVVGGRWGESSKVLLGRSMLCTSVERLDRIGQAPPWHVTD
jgi:hypothetical protein